MEKSLFKNVVTVILGICLLILVFSVFSMAIGAVTVGDLIDYLDTSYEVVAFIRYSCIGLICILIPAIVCYALSVLRNNKLINIASAAISFVLFIICIILIGVSRGYALKGFYGPTYSSATGYFGEVIQVAAAAFILGIYYTVTVLKQLFKKKEKTEKQTADGEETNNEEV